MPASLSLKFATPPRSPLPRHLLGAAARLFETPDSDHHADTKPFAAGLLRPSAGSAGPGKPGDSPAMTVWRLGWLGHGDLPPTWPPRTVRFGPYEQPVMGFDADLWPFARLASVGPARRVRLRMLTPTFFSRNGRDLPLPEPVLIVRSLLARWNAHAPDTLTIDDSAARELVGSVFLDAVSGASEQVPVTEQIRQVGFVGEAELRLLKTASAAAAEVFGALMRFAAIAGVGAQTTHGFGAVDIRNRQIGK
ncbi:MULTISPECIES: CRISPR system precrRNA processing endoribonuclease RAMP protein Cas6 [unclassified Frankia]|uniref:CRISPR system precrRNA processing endoribonuclease RAMP protein Cas6 n=1 Tax=unclassified Frankia TaxID=2632575 RepID=UPI001EF71C45|nr:MULTISPECIES: CRISPR system precrRNA processing endoribonuclease RAMP protein Cas6 [unclassified Frankia]